MEAGYIVYGKFYYTHVENVNKFKELIAKHDFTKYQIEHYASIIMGCRGIYPYNFDYLDK